MKFNLPSFKKFFPTYRFPIIGLFLFISLTGLSFYLYFLYQQVFQQKIQTENQLFQSLNTQTDLKQQLDFVKVELEDLQNQDQRLINLALQKEIENIQSTYQDAVQTYEDLLDLRGLTKDTRNLDVLFAQSLSLLSQRNYASASAILTDLNQQVNQEKEEILTAIKEKEAAAQVLQSNQPPASGFAYQQVATPVGNFNVSIITADLNSTRVIVDTASTADCFDNCPVLSLADYVARNGAFAGVNGSYFCPAEYPSCAGKTNTFDTLLMNKNKVYFNSANNVYSTVPAVIFKDNWARFVSQSLEWGRGTSVDAVLANRPLLILNRQIYTVSGDGKEGSKGGRSFVATTGSTVYIGVVHSATVAEAAQVLHALGLENALNLDNGGSTALWYSGYKVGPGRNLPNALLLVRK